MLYYSAKIPVIWSVPLILTLIFFFPIGVVWLIVKTWDRNSAIRKQNRINRYIQKELEAKSDG